jgi:predicted PhzF superfamily epimerase YddE/YHI9
MLLVSVMLPPAYHSDLGGKILIHDYVLEITFVLPPYVASQGTALGRSGRAHIFRAADGQVWVGGGALTCVSGFAEL